MNLKMYGIYLATMPTTQLDFFFLNCGTQQTGAFSVQMLPGLLGGLEVEILEQEGKEREVATGCASSE